MSLLGLKLAAAWTSAGLKKGDVCYEQLVNGTDLIIANLAAMQTGINLLGIPPYAGEEIFAQAMQLTEPVSLLYDAAFEESAAILMKLSPNTIQIRFDKIPEPTQPLKYSKTEIFPEDTAVVGFTSGTTGVPKALSALHGAFLTSLKLIIKNVDLKPQSTPDIVLVGMPIAGAGGSLVMPTLLRGGAILIPSEISADEFLRLIPLHKVTQIFMTPSLLIDLLDHPKIDYVDVSSLSNIIYGSELLPAAKLEEALRRFGPILQQGYGSSEVLPPISMLQPHQHMRGNQIAPRSVLSSVGRVVPQVKVIIADEDDQPLTPGQIGNILINSPTQFKGYLNQTELNAKILRGGWLHIGDVGYFDTDALLHVLGRKPDIINRNGHITYPRNIEEVVHDHPAVKEATFVQVGHKALMVVSLRHAWRTRLHDVLLEQELKGFLSLHVPPLDMPDGIAILEELPRSPMTKVLRREVRQLFTNKISETT